ncbi:MAG: exodeoxyribonuclease VII large subunit [Endomicrobium sp.]|jgi:exodeoxyribonuclease VII large subunit|nr:exodeoxyribonuclease VII large subunit [Endomicrobium sp.]
MSEELEYDFSNNNDGRLIYTVTQISNEIKSILEDSYPSVWIQGEISNFKLYNSGHMYFHIKDANAQIKAVMFKGANISLTFIPEEGMKVLVCGRISSYPKNGDYQIIVNDMKQYGKGDLYQSYEKLKKKLESEGLFDENEKKTIPSFINKIGIVTSQDGAALHDILKVIDNLNANVEVLIYPVRVQGKEAEKEIPKAIEYLNLYHKNLEVLLVGRGGGSIEDLWAFNTEPVARAIFASEIPVVSCVGHEVDFTIADFVSDMRSPTPSAAAEMILRNRNNTENRMKLLNESLSGLMHFILDDHRSRLDRFMLSRAMTKPYLIYEDKISYVDELDARMLRNANRILESKFEKLKNVSHKLDIISPLAVLKRGFAICFDNNNKILTDSKNVSSGDNINIHLSKGSFTAKVETKKQ